MKTRRHASTVSRRQKGIVAAIPRVRAALSSVRAKLHIRNKKRFTYTSVVGLFIMATLAGILLPAMQVNAERTLTWSDNADFSQNKIADCEATEVNGITVTGSAYGDTSCAANGEDSSMTLEGSEPVMMGDVKQVSAGTSFSVALKNDGTVWTWGYASNGQLGIGVANAQQRLPVQVKSSSGSGFLDGIQSIGVSNASTANDFVVAVRNDGTVWAWGNNSSRQLGDDTTISYASLPVQVKDATGAGFLTGAQSVSVGANFAAILKTDGTVWAWGNNVYGQLGDNTTSTYKSLPVQVKDSTGSEVLSDIKSIFAAPGRVYALKNDGTVWAWGLNSSGILGDNTVTNRALPVQVQDSSGLSPLGGVKELSGGANHTIALKTDGTVWAWGLNTNGQLGDNTTTTRRNPIQVRDFAGAGFIADVQSIHAASNSSFGVKNDGTVWAWGLNTNGQLGDNTTVQKTRPVQTLGRNGAGYISGVQRVAGSSGHSLALFSDGTVWSWGLNSYAQLGDGTAENRLNPVRALQSMGSSVLSNVASIATGSQANHALVVKADGTVWAWGLNNRGQLGDGTSLTANFPVQVKISDTEFFTNAVAAAVGTDYSIILKNDGTVWAWGYNNNGQLGNNTTISSSLPVQVKDTAGSGVLSGIKAVSLGSNYVLALAVDGTVWAWGSGASGVLGDNAVSARLIPAQVLGVGAIGVLNNVKEVRAGVNHSLALKNDGTLWAWGANSFGQLGVDNYSGVRTPVQVKDVTGSGFLQNVTSIASGNSLSYAVKVDGSALAWGYNTNGQIGDGTQEARRLPVKIKDATGSGFLADVSVISAGSLYGMILMQNGTVQSWGVNEYGQLGNGKFENSLLPVSVVGTGGFTPQGTATGFKVDVGAGYRTRWHTLSWQTKALSQYGTVAFSIRTSQDGTQWGEWSDEFVQSSAGSTSHSVDLNAYAMSRFIEIGVKLTTSLSIETPELYDFSLSFLNDTQTPHKNASNIQTYRGQGGASVANGAWSNVAPYFTWDSAEDETNGSGIWGYCLYIGQDAAADVRSSKGLLGSSPINSNGACQYLSEGSSLDLSQAGILGTALSSSSDSYYLIIKAIDNVGNLYEQDAEIFEFKFDNVSPKNPSFISAPAGFIATKNVLLTWPTTGDEGASDDVSGIVGLQYRIGANGTWYGEGHTGAQDITDLLSNSGSYRLNETFDYPNINEGNNVIYFRTYDAAGNTSATYSTAAVKINTAAPSTPIDVTATPETNELNSFAFNWKKPESFVGSEDNLTYCYTVNVLPAANTCQFTSAPSLAADAFATQPGVNTFYVVAKDESGNINYDTYASKTFTANTAAPGVPTTIEIADISTKATSTWKLALSWEAPSDTGAGIARYQINRSADGGVTYTQIATTSGSSYVDAALEQSEYFYKIRACDSANNCGAYSTAIAKTPTGRYTTPPELVTNPSVETSTRRASFYWVTDRNSDSRIQYGTESGVYLPGEITVSEDTKAHRVDVNNLDAGTTYFYRVKWTDEDGNVGVSNEYSFKTLPAPVVKSVEVVKTNLTSTVIRVVTRDAVRVGLYYGRSESFGGVKTINTSLSESTYEIQLEGLDDGASYFFKIVTTDADGNVYDSNRIDTFATPPRPQISGLRFQPIDGEPTSTQKVTWTTNVPTSTLVTYGVTGTSGIDMYAGEMKTSHEMIINNLQDDSDYFLLAQGRDKDGNLAVSDRQLFKTALDTRPPKVSQVRVETSVSGSGQSAQGQVVVYWKTDEPAMSRVAYATGSGATEFTNFTAEDSRLTTDHIVVISNLSFSTIYTIKPMSEDKAGNKAEATPQSAIVGRPTESILDIITSAFSRLFGL